MDAIQKMETIDRAKRTLKVLDINVRGSVDAVGEVEQGLQIREGDKTLLWSEGPGLFDGGKKWW